MPKRSLRDWSYLFLLVAAVLLTMAWVGFLGWSFFALVHAVI